MLCPPFFFHANLFTHRKNCYSRPRRPVIAVCLVAVCFPRDFCPSFEWCDVVSTPSSKLSHSFILFLVLPHTHFSAVWQPSRHPPLPAMDKMDVSNDEYFTPDTSFNEVEVEEEVEDLVSTTGGSG